MTFVLAHAGTDEHGSSLLGGDGRGSEILGQEITFQLIAASIVVLLIVGILGAIVVRQLRRRADVEPPPEDETGHGWVWAGGVALPLIVISAVAIFSASSLHRLARADGRGPVRIEVVAHRWWWEVRYPGNPPVATANDIVIPRDRPVSVRIRTADVLHSFWIPGLERKIDAIPGHVSTLTITAKRTGTYPGECQEFCGLEHAWMRFSVKVVDPAEFDRWLTAGRAPPPAPATPLTRRGERVLTGSTCAACHTVAGTPARGQVGPDLTHVASRPTLAGGAIDNTRGNLAGWISDPRSIKPGANMPPARLTGAELQALIAYLETLQ